MIEVFRDGALWAWAMICPAGRRLVESEDRFATDLEANGAAKLYRASFFATAIMIDGCGIRET